jgi:flavin-dependent dehydrogenase
LRHVESTDVVVVGRGPAGYAAGLGALRRGLQVTIIGGEDWVPRWGETLPATCLPLLSRLGIADELRNPEHLESHGHFSTWGDAEAYERAGLSNAYGPSVILDRHRFVTRLEGTFRSEGGRVVDMKSNAVHRTPEGFQVQLISCCGNGSLLAKAIVDATGAAARVSRRLGGAKRSIWAQQVAFGACYEGPENVELPAITLLEALEHGWLYATPLPNRRRAAIWWVTDAGLMPSAGARGCAKVAARVRQSIEVSRWVREVRLRDTPDWCARSASVGGLDHAVGEGWIAVGDAALTLDPLSSSGILFALLSGLHGGTAIAAELSGETGWQRIQRSYAEMVTQTGKQHLDRLKVFHRMETRWPAGEFWKRRAAEPGAGAHLTSQQASMPSRSG